MWSACFGFAWNRWITDRRLQQRGAPSNICRFGCVSDGGNPEDAIEHYVHCQICYQAGHKMLGLTDRGEPRKRKLFMIDSTASKEERIKWALLTYGTYIALIQSRHRSGGFTGKAAEEAIKQAIRNGTKGSKLCADTVKSTWQSPPSLTTHSM